MILRTTRASSSARTQGLPTEYCPHHADDRIGDGHTVIEQLLDQAVAWADLSFIHPWPDPQAGQLAPERLSKSSRVLAGMGQERGRRGCGVISHDKPGMSAGAESAPENTGRPHIISPLGGCMDGIIGDEARPIL